jgi:hypothetical protein
MQVEIFTFEEEDHFSQVRTVEIDGEIWFVGKDVATLLGYTNHNKTISDHCRLKGVTKRYPLQTTGGIQKVTLINESNVYRLVSRSKLPAAEKFEEWVFDEVIPTIRRTGSYGVNRLEPANFIVRYFENWNKTDKGYFSVIRELFVDLYGKLEMVGYKIPNKAVNGKEIRPDVSVGLLFNQYLRKHHPDKTENFRKYLHKFPNGMEFECKQYPNEILYIFRKFVEDIWIPERASIYFAERDRLALNYLPKLLVA